jgi:hypothetical protein
MSEDLKQFNKDLQDCFKAQMEAHENSIPVDWYPITVEPPPNALIVYFARPARYMFGNGLDYVLVKEEHPSVEYYKIITHPPC